MSEETMPEKQVENTSSHRENEWKSETIGKLSTALAKAQGEMKGAASKSTNPFFNSSYADLHAVIESSVPFLSKHGISVIQGTEFHGEYGYFVTTRLLHESGEWVQTKVRCPLTKKDIQGVGSAITYGRRYGLSAMAGIAQFDDDGNKHVNDPKGITKKHAAQIQNHTTTNNTQGAQYESNTNS